MKSWVYIQFEKNGRFCIGSTADLERRINQHANGHTASTRARGSFELVFKQSFADLKTARKIEKKIKNWK